MIRLSVNTTWLLLAALCACSSNPPAVAEDATTDQLIDCPASCGTDEFCCKQTGTCQPVPHDCQNIQSCGPGEEINYGAGPFVDETSCQAVRLQCSCDIVDEIKPGIWGLHSSLVATDKELIISAYESRYGDLVLARAPLTKLDQPTLEIIDGVPKAEPTKAPSGYRGGISKEGDNVGLATRLRRDGDGKLWVIYHDATNRALKMASKTTDGDWTVQALFTPSSESEVIGRHSDLIVIDKKPVIVFLVENVVQQDGTFLSELRLAKASTNTPKATSDWSVSVVARGPSSCRNLCKGGQKCFAGGQPTEPSSCKQPTQDCGTGCDPNNECLDGACQPVIANSDIDEVPAIIGLWPRLHNDGELVILYHNGVSGSLMGAREDAKKSGFTIKTLVEVSGSRVGGWISSVLDNGILHVAHQNISARTLHYSQVDPVALISKVNETVDDGYRLAGAHFVGADAFLALDDKASPQLLYQDQTSANLLWASRKSDGTWSPNVLSDENLGRLFLGGKKGYGFYTQLAPVQGKLFGSTFVFDTSAPTAGSLKLFELK
jgi:hypothetical protein